MQRINIIDEVEVTDDIVGMLDMVRSQFNMVPNVIGVMANSPATLKAYLGLSGALSEGVLSAKLREQIALTVAGINQCSYCASAHTVSGKQAGLDSQEMALNLAGASVDKNTHTALSLVRQIVECRGQIGDTYLVLAHTHGFSNEEILEIFSHTMLNMFTNYLNHLARTEIDFSVVPTGSGAA